MYNIKIIIYHNRERAIMKKILLVFFTLLTYFIFPDNLKLTKDLLLSTKWLGYSSSFTFKSDNSVIIEDLYDDAFLYYIGIFNIENDKLIIEYSLVKNKSKSINTALINEKYKAEFILDNVTNSKKFELREIIKLINFEKKYNEKKDSLENHKNKISILQNEKLFSISLINKKTENINFILLNNEEAFSTVNLKFRETPSIYAKNYDYHRLLDTYQYLPKEKQIILLARTENKYKIENWNNYWYFIDIKDYNPMVEWVTLEGTDHQEHRGFWVFGEFILKNKYIENYNKAVEYFSKKDYDNALKFYLKSFDIDDTQLDAKKGVSNCYNNKGVEYFTKKDYDNAIIFFSKSYEIDDTQLISKKNLSTCYLNKGIEGFKKKDYESALNCFLKSYELDGAQLDSKKNIGVCYYNIGIKFYNDKDKENSKLYLKKAMDYGYEVDKKFKDILGL
jgi:tetratricopeptide (TPR) repeat protein